MDSLALNEREHLLGQNFCVEMHRLSQTEADDDCPLASEHMHPADRGQSDPVQLSPGMDRESAVRVHCHGPAAPEDRVARNQFIVISVLCFVFMVAEIIGGLLAGSLAIATDATHMASDLTSFLISLLAIWLSRKPATRRLSFGFYRAEVVGALISVLLIWGTTAVLVGLAIQRVRTGEYHIEGRAMVITASIGLAFNVAIGAILHCRICKGCLVTHGHLHGHSHGGHSHGTNSYSSPRHCNHSSLDDELLAASSVSSNGYQQVPPTNISDVQLLVDDVDEMEEDDRLVRENPHAHHSTNVNIRAAMVHVIGDVIQSFGVLTAAIIVLVKVSISEMHRYHF